MAASPASAASNNTNYLCDLGARIKSLRARRGMSRRILAESSGVSQRFLADLESGKGNISILRLRAIAQALGLSIEMLIAERAADTPDYAFLLDYLQRADGADIARLAQQIKARTMLKRSKIALVGLRGAGKSTIGERLALRLKLKFVDLVQQIEEEAGMEVNEIFSLGGQAMYRRFERQCLNAVLDDANVGVVEVGGSLVSEPATYETLLGSCRTFWLRATPNEHMDRVVAQGDSRPMAGHARAMDDLKRILAERDALYRRADAIIETSNLDIEETVREIIYRYERMNVESKREDLHS